MNRLAVVIAGAAAIGLAAVGFERGTYAAGGSDSSCYVLMAEAFASGTLQPSSKLETEVPWPDAPKTFAPGGFVPSESNPAAFAPVCAPGFSLLLAPALKLGGPRALFAVTPLAGALFVWCAFLAARALGGPLAGAMAAVLIATSPIVLFQVVQPMNDIATAMLWMAAFWALLSERWILAGALCGGALLVRPNLLPLALVIGVYLLREPQGRGVARVLRFAVGAAPFVAMVLWLNWSLYGGPLKSGYGRLDTLFALGHIPGNARQYFRWLIQTQTVVLLLGFLAPRSVRPGARPAVWLAFGFIFATTVIYFAYTPFEDWSYLRFLLPAIGLLSVLTSVVVTNTTSLIGPRAAPLLAGLVTISLALNGITVARDRVAFQMTALEQRYRSAGMVVRDRLPAEAAVLSTWDSGAVRFHGRREAIVWDALDPAWLDRALSWLAEHGHQPFILVESWEEQRFRERFGGTSLVGRLDWPPKYEVDRQVRIYDPADRARYTSGQAVITEYVWPLLEGKR